MVRQFLICLILLSSYFIPAMDAQTPKEMMIISASGGVESCVNQGVPVIGTVGNYVLILHSGTKVPGEAISQIPILPGYEYYVASAIYPESILPAAFKKAILFQDQSEFLLQISSEMSTQPLLNSAFKIRRITMKTWKPIPAVNPVPKNRDPNPLIQDMVNEISQPSYEDILEEVVTTYPNRYSCSSYGPQSAQMIHDMFVSFGYTDVSYQDFDSCSDNIIARKEGMLNPDQVWVIGAHYDSYASGDAPGADDNGTGTALVLEIARIFANYEFEDTIEFVLFASEELGLYGSDAYAEAAAGQNMNIMGAICVDMVGYLESGDTPDIDVIDNTASNWMELQVFQSINDYIPGTPYKDSQLPFGASSDHASFWSNGFNAILLFEDYPDYSPYIHSSQDTIGLSVNSYALAMSFSKTAIATLAELAVPAPPEIYMLSKTLDDASGDNDGIPDPGETVNFTITVKNNLDHDATNVQLELSCADNCAGVTINTGSVDLGTIMQGDTVDNNTQPFSVSFGAAIPHWTDVQFDVNITADGPYSNASSFSVTVTGADYSLEHFWDMNADPGWTVTGGSGNNRFQFGTPGGSGGSTGEPDPTTGYTGTNVYGYNLSGDYPNGMPEELLTTTPFDCSELSDTVLEFYCWLGVETSSYDHARIRVSNNGSTWTEIWANGSSMSGGAWSLWSFDISEIADGQSAVQIQWSMGTTDSSVVYCGWNIDDVAISGWKLPSEPTATPTPEPTFTPMPTSTPTSCPPCVHDGDVDGNNTLTPADALMAFQIYLGIITDPTETQECSADCDYSMNVTPNDALCIFQHYLTGACDCAESLLLRDNCKKRGTENSRRTLNNAVPGQIIAVQQQDNNDIILSVHFDNYAAPVTAFGFDITIPEQLQIKSIQFSPDVSGWQGIGSNQEGNRIRIAGFDPFQPLTPGNVHAIAQIRFSQSTKQQILNQGNLFSISSFIDDIEGFSPVNEFPLSPISFTIH